MSSLVISTPPKVGDIAPDFTLTSTSGRKETLSSYRGQKDVLLCFFPFAFSSTCTAEFCDMRDAWDQFMAHELVVFPISVDSKYALAEYKAKYGMQLDLLSDFLRDVSAAYGVLHPERQFSERSYFLIDRAGVVRWAHVEQHGGFRRENAELLAEIARLD